MAEDAAGGEVRVSLPLNLPRRLLERKNVAGFFDLGSGRPDSGNDADLEMVEFENGRVIVLLGSATLHRQHTLSKTFSRRLDRTTDLVTLIFLFLVFRALNSPLQGEG